MKNGKNTTTRHQRRGPLDTYRGPTLKKEIKCAHNFCPISLFPVGPIFVF